MRDTVKCGECANYCDDSHTCGANGWENIHHSRTSNCPDFEEKKQHDSVNHPAHYTAGGIECIEALKAATVGLEGIEAVCTANAIKYLWRWKRKNGVEDINKAIWYLERLRKEVSEDD